MSNSLAPDQDQHSVTPDLVPAVCTGYQQMTKLAASKERVNLISTHSDKVAGYSGLDWRKPVFRVCKNKGVDQPVHPGLCYSLIGKYHMKM